MNMSETMILYRDIRGEWIADLKEHPGMWIVGNRIEVAADDLPALADALGMVPREALEAAVERSLGADYCQDAMAEEVADSLSYGWEKRKEANG
jgi:hypothetical protein